MDIRKITIKDIDIVLGLIQTGREKMIASGNWHQWENGHPSRELIEKDILAGNSYLVMDGEKAVATFALIKGPDPTYEVIYDGKWANERPYYVLHRVASAHGVHGVMDEILKFCFKFTDTIRIDTHADNVLMKSALERKGFKYCGIIHLENGDLRDAYMKTLL